MKNTNKNTMKTAIVMTSAAILLVIMMILTGCDDNTGATPDQAQESQSPSVAFNSNETSVTENTFPSMGTSVSPTDKSNTTAETNSDSNSSHSSNSKSDASSSKPGESSNGNTTSSHSSSSGNSNSTDGYGGKTYHDAVYKYVHHDAEYRDVYVVDRESYTYDDPIYDEREYTICHVCGAEFDTTNGPDAFFAHDDQHLLAGEGSGYHSVIRNVQVGSNTVTVPEEGHYEKELVKEAYDEKVLIREAGWY